MKKLTYSESSKIYGGMAFAAFIAISLEIATSITSIIKMMNSTSGSVKSSTGDEYKWSDNNKVIKNTSPVFFGY